MSEKTPRPEPESVAPPPPAYTVNSSSDPVAQATTPDPGGQIEPSRFIIAPTPNVSQVQHPTTAPQSAQLDISHTAPVLLSPENTMAAGESSSAGLPEPVSAPAPTFQPHGQAAAVVPAAAQQVPQAAESTLIPNTLPAPAPVAFPSATGVPPMQPFNAQYPMQQYPPYYQSPVIIISPNQLQGNNYQPAMQQQPVFQVVNPMHILGPGPGAVQCPNCKQNIVTKIEHISGSTTHLWALVACAFICLPCIPYLVNESKDVRHSCTSCGTTLATYLRSGSTVVHAFGNIQQANTQQSPMMQQAQVTQQSPIVQSTQTPLPQPQAPTQQPQLA